MNALKVLLGCGCLALSAAFWWPLLLYVLDYWGLR